MEMAFHTVKISFIMESFWNCFHYLVSNAVAIIKIWMKTLKFYGFITNLQRCISFFFLRSYSASIQAIMVIIWLSAIGRLFMKELNTHFREWLNKKCVFYSINGWYLNITFRIEISNSKYLLFTYIFL